MPKDPSPAVSWPQVLALRLERHYLIERAPADRLVDVVRELVGVHAQVMSSAELQIAARVDGARVDDVREALWERRQLVKAWSMRGTLHLLAPEHLVSFVDAAATRERWTEAVWLRFVELSEAQMEAIIDAVAATLSDEPMTRADLADAVAARVDHPGMADKLRSGWGTFLGAPAQRGFLVFGPSDGRNVTFVRPSAWLDRPVARSERPDLPDPIDALAGLVQQFLRSFPGSSRDMTGRWWGALRAGLIKQALERLGDKIAQIEADGAKAWTLTPDIAALTAAVPFEGVRLLPGFDPFVNALPRRVDSVLPVANHERIYRTAGWVTPVVLVDGRVAGTWEIAAGKSDVTVQPWARWRGGVRSEIERELDRFAAFLDRPLKPVWQKAIVAAG
ncbi:MAG TPA: winged helix DNA-binding domain-containing protein [Candidatus Limnocylindrales bacterium]|nr:winged helix DNA-binding domain-containing protein [Candidatus Limnocylindrales bacterium]